MPRIPDDLIERIKHEVPVVLLAERARVELKRMGEELMGRCVFHDDSTPSLSINPARNIWQCFGCGAGGTSIDWVMKEKGLDFRQAVELLLREHFASIAVEVLGESSLVRQRGRTRAAELPCPFDLTADDQSVLNEYGAYCHALLKENAAPQEYLKKRGLDSAELVSHFELGYADRSLGLRIPVMTSKAGQEARAKLQRLGILRESGHEHLVGSLVIAIRDLDGNVMGLYGRKTNDNLRKGTPDHLYLSGHHRGVFNEEALKGSPEIILCESLIDALTFWRWGFRNVTSAYGTKGFTDEILESMKTNGTERVLIAFDRDEAGETGAWKVSEKLMAAGIACARVLFPKGMDANEVALKMQPAEKTLALFLRSAEWMGNGKNTRPASAERVQPSLELVSPERTSPVPTPQAALPAARATSPISPTSPTVLPVAPSAVAVAEAEAEVSVSTSATEATDETRAEATEEEISIKPAQEGVSREPVLSFAQPRAHLDEVVRTTEAPDTPQIPAAQPAPSLPAPSGASAADAPSPVSPATRPGLIKLTDDEAELLLGDRRYRVRGLAKCRSYGSVRVSLKVEREGDFFAPPCPISGWHMDTVDLCLHRARQLFERQAAHELGVKEEAIRFDLGKVLKILEEVQEQRISEALTPKSTVPAMIDEERAEGLDYGSAPGLIQRILADYEACGVVGEKTNTLVGHLGGISRLSDRPLAIIVRSSSAAGKTALMDAVLRFIPTESREKYSALSGHALFYFEGKDFKHKVLAIVEEEGAQRASYALKLLQSEGEITIASTGKDPGTGRLVTKEYRVEGPVMIFLSSTHIDIDDELLNRAVVLTVDEGRDQTRAIHRLQRETQTLEGLWARDEREAIYRKHHCFQRLLRRVSVVNPFVRELTFLDDKTRTRRDHTKYLGLIEAVTLLHQFQRPLKSDTRNGKTKEYIEVTLKDVAIANRLAAEVLGRSLDELGPQTRRLLMLLDAKVLQACEARGIDRSDFRFSRRDVRLFTGWSDTQLRIHLSRLNEMEYLLVHRGGRGQSFVYELLYDGRGKDGALFLIGLADVAALAKAHGLAVPKEILEPLAGCEPQTGQSTQPDPKKESTTATSPVLKGTSRGQNGGIAPLPRGGRGTSQPAPHAALSLVSAEVEENSHVEDEEKPAGSYATRRSLFTPRLNLLRFPPVMPELIKARS